MSHVVCALVVDLACRLDLRDCGTVPFPAPRRTLSTRKCIHFRLRLAADFASTLPFALWTLPYACCGQCPGVWVTWVRGRHTGIVALLGEGGFSQLLQAEDTFSPHGTLVAIKVLNTQFAYIGNQEYGKLRRIKRFDCRAPSVDALRQRRRAARSGWIHGRSPTWCASWRRFCSVDTCVW